MSTPQHLELSHIHKAFGSFVALEDINLGIHQGELICFLGPSGCGKTTLLRIIAGLETQTRGTLVQNGRDISRLPPAQRDYGIVFQSYALFPNLTVAANIAYGLTNRKTPRATVDARVAELLRLVGLPGSAKKFPGQLSGGQQQRIALARALATRPGLLLLDEPLSALDALERVRLRHEIRSLQRAVGVTTIMVTHDQEEAMAMADRIVVMNHGRIEQVGSATEIYREPASAFVADFVGKINVLPGSIQGGQLCVGALRLPLTEQARGHAEGPVRVYLRPEDLRPRLSHDAGDAAGPACAATIESIEFLGALCHVHVRVPALSEQPLVLYLSAHELTEQNLATGSALPLKLMSERIRLF